MRKVNKATLNQNIVGSTTSEIFNLDDCNVFSIYNKYTVNTPSAVTGIATTDVDVTENTITKAAHGLVTGLKVQCTTSTTLPGGLSTSTDYFVIVVSSSVFKLATSYANALAGTAINITDQGTGTHAVNPVALAGGSLAFYKSNDGTNWTLIQTATTISSSSETWLEVTTTPSYAFMKITATLTAGMYSLLSQVNIENKNR